MGVYRSTPVGAGSGHPIAPAFAAITIRKPGYATWSRTDVRVQGSGDCGHVRLTRLTAALTPLP